jgi:hypothetical protein
MVTSLLEAQEKKEKEEKEDSWRQCAGRLSLAQTPQMGAPWRNPIRCVRSGANDAAHGAGAQT